LAVRRSALPAVSAASRLRRQPLTVRDAVVERSCCKIPITLKTQFTSRRSAQRCQRGSKRKMGHPDTLADGKLASL
jgi:hypothetical protein